MKMAFRAAVAAGFLLALSSCGSDSGGAPLNEKQPFKPGQSVEGLPPRTSTYVYEPAFSASEPRTLTGEGYELVERKIFHSDGTVTLRTVPHNRGLASFKFDPEKRSALYSYRGQYEGFDDEDDQTFYAEDHTMGWSIREPLLRLLQFGTWGAGGPSPYIGFVAHTEEQEDGTEVEQHMFDGSRTLPDDFPRNGFIGRSTKLSIRAYESETAPFELQQGSARLRYDYDANTFSLNSWDVLKISFSGESGLPELVFDKIEIKLKRSDASLQAEISDSTHGLEATLDGACFGPYCQAVWMDGFLRLPDGRMAVVELMSFE